MYNLTERNERRTRAHALLFAIGLHIGLGLLLYTQMSTPSRQHPTHSAKADVAKAYPTVAAQTADQP